MSHIRGADRSEVLLFPQALDDYVAQDNPVRLIEAFVEGCVAKIALRQIRPGEPTR